MAERFFRATALVGELHLIDIHDWEDWELDNVLYRTEAEVRWLMRTGGGERRVVRTVADLDTALEDSASPHGMYLYVSESLIDEVKRRWEETQRNRRR
jgi:hypothetical protein